MSNLPPGIKQSDIDRAFGGMSAEQTDVVNAMQDRIDDLSDAWEYWHQKARKYEDALYAIRVGCPPERVHLTHAEIRMIADEALS